MYYPWKTVGNAALTLFLFDKKIFKTCDSQLVIVKKIVVNIKGPRNIFIHEKLLETQLQLSSC